jgi:hypothetical protein
VRWSICLGPTLLTSLDGRAAPSFEHYGDVGLQRPIRVTAPLNVGQPSKRFSGFDSSPVSRPLVATSWDSCATPDGWTNVAAPPPDVQARAIAALPDPGGSARGAASYEWPATFRGPDARWIVEVGRSWADWSDRRVVFIRPSGVTVARGEANSHLGRQGKDGALQPGSIHPELVVDVGDWNGDGRVEVLTKFEMYDLDGYILLSADGEPLATFDWFYH